jgi:hypothetical protein
MLKEMKRGTRSKPSARDLKAQDARKRRAAATSPESGGARQGLSALPLGGVPGHHSVHEPVQNEAGALAHVTGESTGAIVPRRQPAPEGGGAATPASSRARCCAQKEGKTGGDYCSQFKGESGELEGEEDATAAELGNGSGSGGAPMWSRRGSHGLWGREPTAIRA